MNLVKVEPVRLYAIAAAILAVVAHYAPDIPSGLWLAIVAAALGLSEPVRQAVTPTAKLGGRSSPS